MKMNKPILLLAVWAIIVTSSFCTAEAQRIKPSQPGQKMEFYLLLGQSNMSGMAPAENEDIAPIERVMTIDAWENWQNGSLSANGTTMGPSLSFCKSLLAVDTNITIGIINMGSQGSLLFQWLKTTPKYEAIMRWSNAGRKNARLVGVLWHQGESDCIEEGDYMSDYKSNLELLITDLRSDLGDPNLPFVLGHLAPEFVEKYTNGLTVNAALDEISAKLDHVGVVTADELTTSDGFHFDRNSQLILGQRYAEAILKLRSEAESGPPIK